MIKLMIYFLERIEGNKKSPAGLSKPLPGRWIYR